MHRPNRTHVQFRETCGLCDRIDHQVNQCKELKHLMNKFHMVSPVPHKHLSNQEKITHCYCRICLHFHHTMKFEHLPKVRVTRATLILHSPRELDLPKPKTQKWQQWNLSPTLDTFRASTSGTKSSVGSHTIYLIGTMVLCTICTGHNQETEACPLMETFRHLCTMHKFQILESANTLSTPYEEPKISLTQASMMEISPPPNTDDTIHHI